MVIIRNKESQLQKQIEGITSMTTNILVFKSGDEDTYVQAGSNKEVCRLTKGMEAPMTQVIHALQEAQGGTYLENREKLCGSGYENFKTKEQLDHEPASVLYMQTSWLTTLIVSTKIEDDLLKLRHELLLTD